MSNNDDNGDNDEDDDEHPNEDYETSLNEIREALISGLQTEKFQDYQQLFDSLSFYTHE